MLFWHLVTGFIGFVAITIKVQPEVDSSENVIMQGLESLPPKGLKEMLESIKNAQGTACLDYANLHIRELGQANSSISYFEFGDPNGDVLLCLHGLSVTGLFFEPYHEYFVEAGIRAIAPCLLGGIYKADPNQNIDGMVSEIVELFDLLGIKTFSAIGFSWGTLVELALLARVSDRIARAGFLGAMTPLKFIDAQTIKQLKGDVRLTLKMVEYTPFMHRCLMWLFCKLPVSALMNQFKDEQLSKAEANALMPSSAFYKHFTRCVNECLRTGSEFYTHGWRMFLDAPRYSLRDLSAVAKRVELRLYVATLDNVHLPCFSETIAAACTGMDVNNLKQEISRTREQKLGVELDGFDQVYARERCSIWAIEGAGRLACALYFIEALRNLMSAESSETGPTRHLANDGAQALGLPTPASPPSQSKH